MKRNLLPLMPLIWTVILLTTSLICVLSITEFIYEVPVMQGSFRFERPWVAILFFIPLLVLFSRGYLYRKNLPRFQISRGTELKSIRGGVRQFLVHVPTAIRTTILTLCIIGMMGPQSIHARDRAETEGIDVMLVLDLSLSMQERDVRPNRFEAMKTVVTDFIMRRSNDRIGAVVFGREAFTLLPLTTDKEALVNVVKELSLDVLDGRGTAIGNATATGLNRLRRSLAKSKVLILLTDGESNAGNVSPEQAAELASAMQVKIYTILMGSEDAQRGPLALLQGTTNTPVNPSLLRSMAEQTHGEFFAVSDRRSLENSFHRILDHLEKSQIEDVGRIYGELYPVVVGFSLILLMIEILFSTLIVRKWP